jgi:hypothetical protein
MSSRLVKPLFAFSLLCAASAPVYSQPSTIVVSRVQYDGNTFGDATPFPNIFTESSVSGVQGSVFLDHYIANPGFPLIGTLALPACYSAAITGCITTSFSSKSEGALMLSVNGEFLTYMGYAGPVGANGISNSYDTAAGTDIKNDPNPRFDRAVALISANGVVSVTAESNAYSGDNPRAAISVDGTQFYMAGNSDSTLYTAAGLAPGPGSTIGARYGAPGSSESYQLGVYFAADRPDESSKQHVKDNNFRGIGIHNNTLYVSKGSGGNGDDGLFMVGAGGTLPLGTSNPIAFLFGAQATCANPPVTTCTNGASSPFTPFGFWFASDDIVYVADEGNPNTDANGNLILDPLAGLEKWQNINGVWTLLYTLKAGLNLTQPQNVPSYPVPTATYGLRNMTGEDNGDGTVTIYAITAQYSSISGGEPDPTKLVTITDVLAATTLPAGETFQTLVTSAAGEAFRGVAFAPCGPHGERGLGGAPGRACKPHGK